MRPESPRAQRGPRHLVENYLENFICRNEVVFLGNKIIFLLDFLLTNDIGPHTDHKRCVQEVMFQKMIDVQIEEIQNIASETYSQEMLKLKKSQTLQDC